MSERYGHRPVMRDECIEALRIRPGGVYVDGTFGRGGHAAEIASHLDETGRLICIDRDRQALEEGTLHMKPWQAQVSLLHGSFEDLGRLLDEAGVTQADGMLFDLGVSSPQLDDPARGFSYQKDAPLDMRMNQDDALTAKALVNEWPEEELRRILWDYGEERYARKIARAICAAREERAIESTHELVAVIRGALPAAALREKQHPAKRSFQAIRIAVNRELEALSAMLGQAVERLRPGGRLAVISFHSLEDRIVKQAMARGAKGCTCPPEFPLCVCGKTPSLRLAHRKPLLPQTDELENNARARSAKLRVAEKIG